MAYLTQKQFEALTPAQRFEAYEDLWYSLKDNERKEQAK